MKFTVFVPQHFIHAGFVLAAGLFFCFIFALPPFQVGIWVQTEPMARALYVLGAACSVWLVTGLLYGWLIWPGITGFGRIYLLWLGWQILATLHSPLPLRSWFGTPETSEGTSLYLLFVPVSLLLSALWHRRYWRRCLLALALIALLVQTILHGMTVLSATDRYIPNSWRPAQWGDYLAFMVFYLWIAARHSRWLQGYGRIFLGAIASGAILSIAANDAASIFFAIALAGSAILGKICTDSRWRRIVAAASLAPLVWLAISATIPNRSYSWPALEKEGSVGSRAALSRIALKTLGNTPSYFLIGAGWGSFPDAAFAYAVDDNTRVFQGMQRHPDSALIDGTSAHSHNQPLEALLSLGIPGMLGWVSLPMLVIFGLSRQRFWHIALFVVALSALSGFWFELPQCLPYKALCVVALTHRQQRCFILQKSVQLILLALLTLSQGWSAYEQHRIIKWSHELRAAAHALPADDTTPETLLQDAAFGGVRLRASALFFEGWLELKQQKTPLDANDANWYKKFLEAAQRLADDPRQGAYAASLPLLLSYQALERIPDPKFSHLHQSIISQLPERVIALAQKAPLRDDLATPLLLNTALLGDHTTQVEFLTRLLKAAPNHRGALWKKGALLLRSKETQSEGEALQKKAFDLGVSNIYPVSE